MASANPSDLTQALKEARRRKRESVLDTLNDVPPAIPDPDVAMNSTSEADIQHEIARLEAANPLAESSDAGMMSAYGHLLLPTPTSALNGGSSPDEIAQLRAENVEMHRLIDELKQIFEQATQQEAVNSKTIADLKQHHGELERLVTERDSQITMLTGQIAELEQHIQDEPAKVAPAPTPNEDELAKMADELEKERCKLTQDRRGLEQDRQQLQEDEESLMKQMREMEVQMAKERADLARQRTELQRLHSEVKHELDQLQRGDGALKDRLSQFQRRHQAVFDRGVPQEPTPSPTATPEPASNGRSDSGLIRRLFGRG